MIEIPKISVEIGVDDVLRGQGADPAVIRQRSPHLVKVAENALDRSKALLDFKFIHQHLKILAVRHNKIMLENNLVIDNPMLIDHLKSAEWLSAILCTVGPGIEKAAIEAMEAKMVLGLAIDGVGSAGVEGYANALCANVESQAKEQGLKTTIPLSPGMVGWPVEEGQPFIFKLLKGDDIGVELTESILMRPRKSLSMILGIGSNISLNGSVCDFCAMKENCRYKDHYE